MKNRYKKFVLEAEEGITFEVSEGTSGELIIKAHQTATTDVYAQLPAVSAGEYAEELSVYTDKDGNKAVVLPGWTVSGVSEENTIWGKDVSLVIYRIPKEKTSDIDWENPDELNKLQRTYNQLVWCPVGMLDSDGTLDGENFDEKFGRRNYRNKKFSEEEFHEKLEGELLEQSKSVKKYGGFYITRYDISKGSKGEPRSVKGAMPSVKVDFPTASAIATFMAREENTLVKSHLTYGAENDSVLAWLIKSGSKTRDEITKDSTNWGNHWNTSKSPHKMVETGSREEWCANNIYDFAGNVDEWTQEEYSTSRRVARGGTYANVGYCYPVDYRDNNFPSIGYSHTGFRATYYIE